MFTSVYFVIGRILQGDSFDSLKGELAIDRSSAWFDAAAGASQVAAETMPHNDARLQSLRALEQHIVSHSRKNGLISDPLQAIQRIKDGEQFCEIKHLVRMDDEASWESAVNDAVSELPNGVFNTSNYAEELRELQSHVARQLIQVVPKR